MGAILKVTGSVTDQYEVVDIILNKALDKFKDSPSRSWFLLAKAINLLSLKEWEKAENCLDILLKEFDNKDVLKTPLTEKGEKKVELSTVQVLKAALYIWQQRFEDAYKDLHLALTNTSIGGGEWKAIEGVKILFPALNAHFDNIPKKIFTLIQNNEYIQDDVLTGEDEDSIKYPKVYQRLQKGFFKKKKMKSKHKDISKLISKAKKDYDNDEEGKQDKEKEDKKDK